MSEGTNIVSFIRTGGLDYNSNDGTWSGHGGDRTNSEGNTEVSVLDRVHLQFIITSLVGRYSTRDKSVQVTEAIVLPVDRWSSSGVAVVEGEVYLRDQPGIPSPVCNLRLIKGPLPFIILEPKEDTDQFFTAINNPQPPQDILPSS